MSLINLSPSCQDFMLFLTLLLFIMYIYNILLTLKQRNYMGLFLSLMMFFSTYLLHEILRSFIVYRKNGRMADVIQFFGKYSLELYVAAFILLFLVSVGIHHHCILWKNTHITPSAVKESLDYLPSGIAIYQEDGSCMIVNHQMNRLSTMLLGHGVLDGNELYQAVEQNNMLVTMGDMHYLFHHQIIVYGGDQLHELIADDVTELVEKSQAIQEKNEELRKLALKMKQYGNSIDDTIRSQEILQAKMNIHDEMNQLLLATGHAANCQVSEQELKSILRTWQNNALLLCKEADTHPKSNTEKDLETLGRIIGIEIVWSGELPEENTNLVQTFGRITKEAMNNAVKHANASHLYVRMDTSDDMVTITYTNDGKNPEDETTISGGLKNISLVLEKIGGTMNISSMPEYALTVTIPLGGN